MKSAIFIMAIVLTLFVSCDHRTPEGSARNFGGFELNLPIEYSVKQMVNPYYTAWCVYNSEDSLTVIYQKDTTGTWGDPKNYGFDTPKSLSMYDGYLHPNKQESAEFKISYFEVDGIKGRIVQRMYKASGRYLEISFKDLCGKPSVIQITGSGITEKTENMIINSSKAIILKCN